eukprot:gene6298-6533_t
MQKIAHLQRDLGEAHLQNEQLKLEVLRWRKQSSLLRLKLASAKENVQITERNLQVLAEREQQTSITTSALKSELDAATLQLTAAVTAKAMAQAESAKYQVPKFIPAAVVPVAVCVLSLLRAAQGQALKADVELTKLTEELKLANGRSSATTTHATEVQQQLQAAREEIAAVQKQLVKTQEGKATSIAAQEQLQQELRALQADLHRSSTAATKECEAAANRAATMELQGQVATLHEKVTHLEAELQAAVAAAQLEAQRAEALQQELEHQKEQQVVAAMQRVDQMVQQLSDNDADHNVSKKEAGRPGKIAGRAKGNAAAAECAIGTQGAPRLDIHEAAAVPSHAAGATTFGSLKSSQPPSLSFMPQSAVDPAVGLLQPGTAAAVKARVSAVDMLKKLSNGTTGDKPGTRKRKPVLSTQSGTMDVIPANMLMKPSFQVPKMRKGHDSP